MRVFIGIQLPQEIQEKIFLWQEAYQHEFEPSGIRWIRQENLHVTIIPPWVIDNEKNIIHALNRKILGSSFGLHFANIAFMPASNPKFVWSFGDAPQALLQLRQNISNVLKRPLEKRNYMMHTTIGRIQKIAKFENLTEKIAWELPVRKFSLFQTHLHPRGAEYEVLQEFSLG